ncbi:MAG: deoxyribodipyrimidine photo-lyase [Nitriliruptoraceae bacterium]|nr:deoxyribodipyrimidine photo-lyase [Nitriliruptoraceae bacterium]
MSTAVVLFTRDLRVHDQPALAAACAEASRVVPLFVFDDTILSSRYAAPNRVQLLVDAVRDLRRSLKDRGGELLVRRGDTRAEVAAVCREVEADTLHLSRDLSGYASRRLAGFEDMARDELGGALRVVTHDTVTVVPAGAVTPTSGDHFKVFTPYFRRWVQAGWREVVAAPATVPTPTTIATGAIPAIAELTDVDRLAGELPDGGETVARTRADAWFDGPVDDYEDRRNLLAQDGTSKLSHHLHLGTISALELAQRVDRRDPGQESFLSELCWRDFNHQMLAARPDLVHTDIRTQGDDWRDDEDVIEAWKTGTTGYPVVAAGMRPLVREGWMHNRARMITASFLTKHCYVDWRVGAWHFMDHLIDGDLANNFGQWQWTAGTGTDSRPNRMFNPVTQSQRYDPDGTYIRRYVEELADLDAPAVHAPWEANDTLFAGAGGDYPPPIVDHAEARDRFLAARGK